MTTPNSNRLPDADLDWLAFQYAAGELRDEDLNRFEQLLATDERACFALTEAVMLGQAIAHCEATAQPLVITESKRAIRHNLWRNLTAACGVAGIAFGLGMWQPWADHTETPIPVAVASLWLQGADDDLSNDPLVLDNLVAVEIEGQTNDELEEQDDDFVPTWLLAAVTHENAVGEEEMMTD